MNVLIVQSKEIDEQTKKLISSIASIHRNTGDFVTIFDKKTTKQSYHIIYVPCKKNLVIRNRRVRNYKMVSENICTVYMTHKNVDVDLKNINSFLELIR